MNQTSLECPRTERPVASEQRLPPNSCVDCGCPGRAPSDLQRRGRLLEIAQRVTTRTRSTQQSSHKASLCGALLDGLSPVCTEIVDDCVSSRICCAKRCLMPPFGAETSQETSKRKMKIHLSARRVPWCVCSVREHMHVNRVDESR